MDPSTAVGAIQVPRYFNEMGDVDATRLCRTPQLWVISRTSTSA
ncbi:MAG TPA: hypothetical protein VFL57_07130 [Bryobacteraceae bacterium]|nr:hypothetical protein [Bryobacteraceae bacterium]